MIYSRRMAMLRSQRVKRALFCAALVALYVAIATFLVKTGNGYGATMFAALPLWLGFVAGLGLPAMGERPALWQFLVLLTLMMVIVGGLMFMVGIEGLLCLAMAAPMVLVFALAGAMVAAVAGAMVAAVAGAALGRGTSASLIAIATFGLMFLTGVEAYVPSTRMVAPVVTTIDIDAPPEEVWKYVISFPELSPPAEWYFRAGIDYPIRARIEGTGVGSVRHCEFNTGAFVEPVTVWEEPRHLAFDVVENPPPMQEVSIYPHLHTGHLQGFMVSQKGEFLLEGLEGGKTRLHGTTWYEHGLWPEAYWRWWSDAIIHRIHLRVLNHIKQLSEAEVSNPTP